MLLGCKTRGPGSNPGLTTSIFKIGCTLFPIGLKYCQSDVNPQNNQTQNGPYSPINRKYLSVVKNDNYSETRFLFSLSGIYK